MEGVGIVALRGWSVPMRHDALFDLVVIEKLTYNFLDFPFAIDVE
jgi:hypothetical protein